MKLWKIFLTFVVFILSITIIPAKADNITGQMGDTSTLSVGTVAGSIDFSGYASPLAMVFFVEDGNIVGTTQADGSSQFDKTLGGLAPIIHTIGIYATDADSNTTITTNFNVNVVENTTTFLSGIILPPSFTLSSSTVKRPAELIGHGRALNNATVQIFISGSNDNLSLSTSTDAAGAWSVNLNPKLHLGIKTASAMALNGLGGQSELSEAHGFTVQRSADLNADGRVDLTDFSILMFSYGSQPIKNVISDINDDGVVDLVDFSIMMSSWSH